MSRRVGVRRDVARGAADPRTGSWPWPVAALGRVVEFRPVRPPFPQERRHLGVLVLFLLRGEHGWPRMVAHVPEALQDGRRPLRIPGLRRTDEDGSAQVADIVPTERHVLRNIEPGFMLALVRPSPAEKLHTPEVEIVDGALLISHVDVEGEEVNGWEGPPAEGLEEGREAVPIEIRHRRGRL